MSTDGTPPALALLQRALDFVNDKLGEMLDALQAAHLQDDTAVILSAKHGQSPQDPGALTRIDDGAIVAEFPAAHDGTTFPINSGIDLAKQRARVFADSRTGAADLPPYRLRHPEAGGTRV